jgi:hypothetical protein
MNDVNLLVFRDELRNGSDPEKSSRKSDMSPVDVKTLLVGKKFCCDYRQVRSKSPQNASIISGIGIGLLGVVGSSRYLSTTIPRTLLLGGR